MPLQPLSLNSSNLPSSTATTDKAVPASKKNVVNSKVTDYKEKAGAATKANDAKKGNSEQEDQVDMACEACCRFYYEWNDEQADNEWDADVVKSGKKNMRTTSSMFLAHVAGCHDANFTAGEVFLNMLKDERAH